MGVGEYRHKQFINQFNITSLILEGDAITALYVFCPNALVILIMFPATLALDIL